MENPMIGKVDKNISEDQLLEQLDFDKIPRHIAIIMDGNRRWAKEKGLPPFMGHPEGVKAFKKIMTASVELGVEVLTVYAFSSENWKRSQKEIEILMDLFVKYCQSEKQLMKDTGVRLNVIGNTEELSQKVQDSLKGLMDFTKDCSRTVLNLCVNYGSRREILDAVRNIVQDVKSQKINMEDLDEAKFSDYLFTKGQPDPELMIRTSGEIRLSNFLLWQNAYSEFWFTDLLWPDFDKKALLTAIIEYQRRNRRFGGG